MRLRSRSRDLTAVDVQHLTGDERSRLQEQNAVDDVADEPDAPEGM
jgi:hypothetical protein